MNLEELQTFIKLCEIKNFTKTAELLTMSQPTVSLHIKNLEQQFQSQLIQRSTKQISITPTGEILLDQAKQIIQLYEQTKQQILEHHHTIQGDLTIGASFTIGEYILPTLLIKLKSQHPNLSLQISIGNTEEIVAAVKKFQVDIGLIEGATNEKSLIIQPFMKDELVVIASKEHPLAKKKQLHVSDLQNEDWVSRELGSGTQANLMHFLHANGLKVNSMLTISSNQGIKQSVINGLGISLLSKHVVERDHANGDIAILQLDTPPLFRTLSYIYSSIMLKKGNVKTFLDILTT
ncbi:LysR family transcriptional regulator [Solibacillus sp. FSL H8-0523]|uniref:LysR family transcriptional regulator n=1 Tax=unclassified Solibacillus TaxID=2637870 RepID=UPI003100B19A